MEGRTAAGVRRRGAAVLVALTASLAAPVCAQAATLAGYFTIQAKQPPGTSPRDHRVLYVTAMSSSTSEPLRLQPYISDPVQRKRQQWVVDQQSRDFDGHTYTAYIIVNGYYHGCMSWIAPLIGNGTRVGLAAYPQNCASWPQRWVLNNGSSWVAINDRHGNQSGFQLDLPVRPGLVQCLDVTELQYTAGNHLQQWRCTGGWNQTFFVRQVVGS